MQPVHEPRGRPPCRRGLSGDGVLSENPNGLLPQRPLLSGHRRSLLIRGSCDGAPVFISLSREFPFLMRLYNSLPSVCGGSVHTIKTKRRRRMEHPPDVGFCLSESMIEDIERGCIACSARSRKPGDNRPLIRRSAIIRLGSGTPNSEVGSATGGPAHCLRRGPDYRRRRGGTVPALDRHWDVLASGGALSSRGRDPYRGRTDKAARASRG